MKTKAILILIFIQFFIFSSFSQWVKYSPYPTSNYLHDVTFINQDTGWSCGADGTILFTEDGGEHWSQQYCPVAIELYKMSFINDQHGWIIGESGTIISTSNGGHNWVKIFISDTITWRSIQFKNVYKGWAVGQTYTGSGLIMHTENGGLNWELQLLDPGNRFTDICFTNTTLGWVVGEYGIKCTSNGGENWSNQYYSSSMDNPRISMVDSLNGWVTVTGTVLFQTKNGGGSWVPNIVTANQYTTIIDIGFQDIYNGWIICKEGQAGTEWCYPMFTSDGGVNWNSCSNYTNPSSMIDALYFTNPETGWLVGSHGSICCTKNRTDWDMQSLSTNYYQFTDLCFTSEQKGFAIGNHYDLAWYSDLFQTNDAGKTWSVVNGFFDCLQKIYKVDNNNFWITGEFCNYQSKDGGENWQMVDAFGTGCTLDIFFMDTHHGWAACWYASDCKTVIYHTSDEGENWVEKYVGEWEQLSSIQFLDQERGWAVGQSCEHGIILNTTDGGLTWTNQLSDSGDFFRKVYFSDVDHGWVAGNHGSIFRTYDGGENWIQVNDGFEVVFEDVFIADTANLWAVGSIGQYPEPVVKGLIYYSHDGGLSWTEHESGTSNELKSIYFNGTDKGWVAGGGGTILYNENGGAMGIPIEEQTNANYRLITYPNPISSVVNIQFELEKRERVELLVCSLSGKTNSVIVSEVMAKGKHQLQWNTNNLKPGIYFFILKTHAEIVTKKLIKL
jgi:photosystem II stability/assembly factor-like uncharacterized protein